MQDVKTKEELWRTIENSDKKSDWYGASVNYWDKQEASVNGVLGGYGHVSDDDIDESRKFLVKAFRNQLKQAEEGKRRLVAIGNLLYSILILSFCIYLPFGYYLARVYSVKLP